MLIVSRGVRGAGFAGTGYGAGLTPAQWDTVLGRRHTIEPRWDWEHGKSRPWRWTEGAAKATCAPLSSDPDVRAAYLQRGLALLGQSNLLPNEPSIGGAPSAGDGVVGNPEGLAIAAQGQPGPYWCPARSLAALAVHLYMGRKRRYDDVNCAWDSPGRCLNQGVCYTAKGFYVAEQGFQAVFNKYLQAYTLGLAPKIDINNLISKMTGEQKQAIELRLLSFMGWDCNPSWSKAINPVKYMLPVFGYADLNDAVGDLIAWGVIKIDRAGTELRVLSPPRNQMPPPPITQALKDVEWMADLHKELFGALVVSGLMFNKPAAPPAPVVATLKTGGLTFTPPPPSYPPGTIATVDPAGGYRVAIPKGGS